MKKNYSSALIYIIGSIVIALICICIIWAHVSKSLLAAMSVPLIFVVIIFAFFIVHTVDNIKSKKPKPVLFEDDILGQFTLDQSINRLETEIVWSGDTVWLSFYYGDENENQACVNFARDMFNHQEEWDGRIREYAAEALTSLANDWSADEATVISEEDFKSRITLGNINIANDGSFTFWFDDDNMFFGHTVEVSGNVESGPDRADIPG